MSTKQKTLLQRAGIDAEKRYREGTIEHAILRAASRLAWVRGYRVAIRDSKRKPARKAQAPQ